MALSEEQKMTYAQLGYAASPDWYLDARDAGRERTNIPWDDLDEYDRDQLAERVGAGVDVARKDLVEEMIVDAKDIAATDKGIHINAMSERIKWLRSFLPTENHP